MDVLEVLMEEHEIILYAIDVLGESATRLKNGKNMSKKFFDDFLEIAKNFADRCHHAKEETVLFPLIEKRDSSQHDTVSVLFAEHEKGRAFLAKLRDAVATNDVKEIMENSDGYANLLRQHIQKENLLFPKWLNTLGDVDRTDMFEKFEEIEEKVIGKGKHEEYTFRIKNLLLQIQ